jgi:uncharacterized protein (DUF697 family)
MSQAFHRLNSRFADFWWGDRGLSAILLLLFAAIFLSPFFESDLLRRLSGIFISLLLISGVAYVSPRHMLRWAAMTVVLTAIVLHWLQEFQPSRGLDIAASLATLLCMVSLTLVVLVRVFRDTGSVTTSRVQGAVAAYVLFGITWSILYRLLDLSLPTAFSLSATPGMTPAEQRETFAYFSFVTMTTLGYGDVTAVHPIARMFVVLEALVGQLYPATLLARLVSLEISHRSSSSGEPTAGES